MSDRVGRIIPIPYAFDTATGYWTGEPDLALLRTALLAAFPDLAPEAVESWFGVVREQRCSALACGGVEAGLRDGELVLAGEPAKVARAAAVIEATLAGLLI